MKRQLIAFTIAITTVWGFSSCESCVKKTTKKATEISISAIEGVAEALDEKGEYLAEKTTDVAGKLVIGMSKSLEKQLDAHAKEVASTTGRTSVQIIDGLADGINSEIKSYYNEIPYQANLASGVSIDLFANFKDQAVVDTYFVLTEEGEYHLKYECYANDNNLFLTKEMDIKHTTNPNNMKYTLASFALNEVEQDNFDNIKLVKITVTKEK